ncbi:MAG: type IV secretion system protein [Psittacicella sp.]
MTVNLLSQMETSYTPFLNAGTDAVNSLANYGNSYAFQTFIMSFYIVYLLFQGFKVFGGRVNFDEIRDDIVRSTLVFIIVFQTGNYMNYCVPFIENLGNDLGNLIINQSLASPGTTPLSTFISDLGSVGNGLMSSIANAFDGLHFSVLHFPLFQLLSLFYFCLTTLIGYSFIVIIGIILMILNQFAITLLAVMGELFIVLALFRQTKYMCYAWLKQVASYNLTVTFYIVITKISVVSITDCFSSLFSTTNANGTALVMNAQCLSTGISSLIVFILFGILMLEAHSMANVLTGGASSNRLSSMIGSFAGTALGSVSGGIGKGIAKSAKNVGGLFKSANSLGVGTKK